jgi:hypothetical protein
MHRAKMILPYESLIGKIFAVKNITSVKLLGNKYDYAFIITGISSCQVFARALVIDDFSIYNRRNLRLNNDGTLKLRDPIEIKGRREPFRLYHFNYNGVERTFIMCTGVIAYLVNKKTNICWKPINGEQLNFVRDM